MTSSSGQPALVAVLLNPPAFSAGARSRNAVSRAASALGFDSAVIANLCRVPTPSIMEINTLGRDAWDQARADLEAAVSKASAVLAGWGVAGLTGAPRRWRHAQVGWLTERARESGIESFWMVGAEPRHPSRWHQYVSDKYGRTSGGTFEQRIAQVLVEMPFAHLPG